MKKRSMKKYDLPYHDGIKRYLQEKRVPFHMPGHKNRFLTEGISSAILPKSVFMYDLETCYDREDLYHPRTFLKTSYNNVRDIYKTKHSFYLVNGSTGGNQAALFASLAPNDKILLPRNVHRLIYGALVATHARPIYLDIECHDNILLAGIDPKKLEAAFQKDPAIKLFYLVNPNYTGVCSDMQKLVDIAKKYNKIIVVDEAHGAHFNFHPALPLSAVQAKADLVVQSTHKTLNALSQTALLHVIGDRVSLERVEMCINSFQTTSPNMLFLLSLEAAIMQMANRGEILLEKILQLARWAREEINTIPFLHCYGKELIHTHDIHDYDETKLYIDVSGTGLNGNEVRTILGRQYRAEAEFSDQSTILFMITVGDTEKTVAHLVRALKKLAPHIKKRLLRHRASRICPVFSTNNCMTPSEVFYAKQCAVALKESVHKICAEMIVPYPPGIPILMPGEMITQEQIEYILYLKKIHSTFSGTAYKNLSKIMVVDKKCNP